MAEEMRNLLQHLCRHFSKAVHLRRLHLGFGYFWRAWCARDHMAAALTKAVCMSPQSEGLTRNLANNLQDNADTWLVVAEHLAGSTSLQGLHLDLRDNDMNDKLGPMHLDVDQVGVHTCSGKSQAKQSMVHEQTHELLLIHLAHHRIL